MKEKEWVDWLNAKVLQKAVVIDGAGNYLAIKRASGRPGARPGKWDLPGGSMRLEDLAIFSQPHLYAMTREVMEETGLGVTEIEPVWIGSGTKKTNTAGEILVYGVGFRCKVKGIKPEIRLSEEHTESKWGSKDEILSLDFGEDGGMHSSIVKES